MNTGPIDIHTHVVPESFPEMPGRDAGAYWPSMAAQSCGHNIMIDGRVYRKVDNRCWNCDRRQSDMAESRIGVQVLSPMPELFSYWMEIGHAKTLIRYINEYTAKRVADGQGQFVGLAGVPLQDVPAAIDELLYAKKELGMAGVEIGTNVNGKPLGHPDFEPFFAAAASAGAAIFVHPIRPAGMDRLIGPPNLEQLVAFPGETGLCAMSLITSGLMTKYPDLRIAFSHGGGTLNALLPRIAHGRQCFPKVQALLSESPVETARKFFFDTLVYDLPTLRRLIEVFGDTQLCVGTDYPFDIKEDDPVGMIEKLEIEPDARERLLMKNARRWLGI